MDEQATPTQDVPEDVIENEANEVPVNNEESPSEAEPTVEVEAEQSVPAEAQSVAAPAEDAASEDEEDFDIFGEAQMPAVQVPSLDFSQLPQDAEGNIDPSTLAQAINYQVAAATEAAKSSARAEYLEMRKEEQLWSKAQEKYPELKANRDLREMVKNARYGAIIEGKNPTPAQIADQLFKHIGNAKSEGMKAATENVKIQQTAYVETSGKAVDTAAQRRAENFNKIRSTDPLEADAAQRDLLKEIIFGDNN